MPTVTAAQSVLTTRDIKDMRSHISQIKATSLSVVEAKGIAKIFVTMFDETLQKTVERILYQK